jgi:hypothetical protein
VFGPRDVDLVEAGMVGTRKLHRLVAEPIRAGETASPHDRGRVRKPEIAVLVARTGSRVRETTRPVVAASPNS